MTTCFLVGADGSQGGQRAAEFAAERARREQAKLVLVHVVDWSPYEALAPEDLASRSTDAKEEIESALRTVLEPLAARLRGPGLEPQLLVRHGHPAETLHELAKELGASQLFVGRRGRSKLSSLLFGSVSGSLVQISTVPVTVVP